MQDWSFKHGKVNCYKTSSQQAHIHKLTGLLMSKIGNHASSKLQKKNQADVLKDLSIAGKKKP